jgi:hypothetical protein
MVAVGSPVPGGCRGRGSLLFLYETKFHPGVAFRDTTIGFWVGANDNLLRKIVTLTKETLRYRWKTGNALAPATPTD